ncbi:MAG: aminopeptidase P N-terminal domain-containing protein [Burkholderiales bacterium]|nr:aminopeptidase P N-terminal domain-containing protein [Burkholderiales bacterium]
MQDNTIYLERRRCLLDRIQGVVILPTSAHQVRNRDSHYPFRFDSHFYYLTGFAEPESVLVMIACESPKSILFCREKNIDREIWDGYRFGPDAAKDAFLFDEAHPISSFEDMLPKLLADQPGIHYPVGQDGAWDTKVLAALNAVRDQARSGIRSPSIIHDIRREIEEMRLFKDGHEISLMKRSAEIASNAHRIAMKTARPGAMEFEVEAELLREFRRQGAQAPAYASIVAGGGNACVLHYVENNARLRDGDLLLIDAGCELDGYASDITRTFPVNGRFSPAQKDIYEMVLAAQGAALAEVRPGAHWNAPHDAAVRVIARGLVDLKLCRGSVDAVIDSGDYKRFYMHRTGHWLGLDVHDAGEYKIDGAWRELTPGMVLTVEPGCYIRPSDDIPEALWNIGIRIEDDVHVVAGGHEILSRDAPKSTGEIEEWMAS